VHMPAFAKLENEARSRTDVAAMAHRAFALPFGVRWLMALLFCVYLNAYAAHPWRVVILPGADPTLPAASEQIQVLRTTLAAAAPDGVEFYTDSLDGLRFDSAALMPDFLALMRKKYQNTQIDLVIGLADFALEFTKKYHSEIWPGVPVLISSIEDRRLHGLPPEFAHVQMRLDIDGTLAMAEALQPQAQRLVLVGGVSPYDRDEVEWAAAVAAQRKSRKWSIELWRGLPLVELRQRLAALDRRSAVIYTGMFRDRDGRTYFPYQLVGPMSEVSGAPIYSWYSTYLGHGLTGGSMISFKNNGRLTAELAASILLGKTTAAGGVAAAGASQCAVDVGRMEKLGLRTESLPADCELTNVPPSIWRQYRGMVLLALTVLALQAITIAALLWQRRRRHAAEDEATLRRSELARAARFASAGELSASIAHEVGQPLSAILSNADAAGMVLEEPSPEISELHAILADVRRDALRANEVVQRLRSLLQKQPVAFGPLSIDDTLAETLALLGPEARRRGVTLESSLGATHAGLYGDRIQLQQVLLNLTINAMDAMHDTDLSARVLSVSTHQINHGIELLVADRGHGIPPGAKARLFESLYTTKPHGMGLGLSIVRTIVNAHNGHVTVEDREGGGSVFRVWIPESKMAEVARSSQFVAGSTVASDQLPPHSTVQGGHS
jgi:signal transduction histidine kinase